MSEDIDTKKPWASKSMWLGLLTTAATLLSFWNAPLADFLKTNTQLILTVVGGLIMLVRAVTKSGIKI